MANRNQNNKGQMLQGMQGIQVDPSQFKNFECPNCQHNVGEDGPYTPKLSGHFTWVVEVKMVPALLSPAGKPSAMFNQLGLACLECGWEADLQTVANLVKEKLEK